MATPASPADHPDRRLIGGLLVSLLLHGLVLLLQFGVPGLGAPGTPPPLTVRIAAVNSPAPPLPVPVPVPEVVAPPSPPKTPRPVTGMQVVDPVETRPPPKAVPVVKKDRPRRAKRISTPMASHETLVEPSRVISQDSTANDFKVPLPRPEEAVAKSIDPKEAQEGEDDGDAATSAALEAAEARGGKLKAEEEAKAALQAELKKAEEEKRRGEQLAQQQKADQDAARLREQQLAEQKADQLKVEQQKAEQQKAEQLKAEQLKAEQLKTEQLKLEQKKAEQLIAERERAEQLKLEQQKAEQAKLAQQKAEQAKLEQQKAEQQRAEQQKAEQQRAEQQRAEQQRAEQQRAEQQRAEREAAQQRGRELAAAAPGSAGQGGPTAGTGAGGGTQIPKNMLGSDLGNRARDLVKGLDLLPGAPPTARKPGDRRVAVSFNERDLSLKMYVDSWRQKLERNGALNYPRSWADQVRIDPLVSVAVRSDGSVEDVVIVQSSGRPDMDEAVRRIVRVNARYSPFPPNIAERYDVIDFRRVWRFDDTLKLMEELH